MEKKITIVKYALILGMLWGIVLHENLNAQEILYNENFGNPNTNTLIQNYTGWQDTTVLYFGNGTCDIRTTNASNGYSSASGGGNVMINDTNKWFQVSGINALSESSELNLYIGLRKTAGENGTNFKVEFSVDSLLWQDLSMEDTLPTGTGTSGWYRVKYHSLPVSSNLHLRFSNKSNVEFRLDDILIINGEEVVLETVSEPLISVAGGIYYEPQIVSITTETVGAEIRYTTNGDNPDINSTFYTNPLTINESCVIKAIAVKNGMNNSNIITESFVIIDTNALVELPFDISNNSSSTKQEIKTMNGFKSKKLGNSYSDGAAKFETKNAGNALLIAQLDGMPDSLYFDLQGNKSGSSNSYSGICFEVSQSSDGEDWEHVAVINESNINTNRYSHFGPYPLNYQTRYVRWLLKESDVGNTQLNNIKITKRNSAPTEDEVGILSFSTTTNLKIAPNPISSHFRIITEKDIEDVRLYDVKGNILRVWSRDIAKNKINVSDLSKGEYILVIKERSGLKTSRLILKI